MGGVGDVETIKEAVNKDVLVVRSEVEERWGGRCGTTSVWLSDEGGDCFRDATVRKAALGDVCGGILDGGRTNDEAALKSNSACQRAQGGPGTT